MDTEPKDRDSDSSKGQGRERRAQLTFTPPTSRRPPPRPPRGKTRAIAEETKDLEEPSRSVSKHSEASSEDKDSEVKAEVMVKGIIDFLKYKKKGVSESDLKTTLEDSKSVRKPTADVEFTDEDVEIEDMDMTRDTTIVTESLALKEELVGMEEVQCVLEQLEKMQHPDRLKYGENLGFLKMAVSEERRRSKVLLSDEVWRFYGPQKRKIQDLIVTETMIYFLKMNSGLTESCFEKTELGTVQSIWISTKGDHFVLKCPEVDFWCCSARRIYIVPLIAHFYRALTGYDLNMRRVQMGDVLEELALTRPATWVDDQGTFAKAVRKLVSKNKLRFQSNGFDLDLAYITERIIAMGFPASDLEGLYRNHYIDVYKFLELRHKKHYKVYNLCIERSYDSKRFDGRCAVYPFPDHNPPPLKLILECCKDAIAYLKESSENVVAIHCKAGKGRTGVIISCLLMMLKICPDAKSALEMFAKKRTSDAKGVVIPSQIRYVHYFGHVLHDYIMASPPRPFEFTGELKILTSMILTGHPYLGPARDGHRFYFTISVEGGTKTFDYNVFKRGPAVWHPEEESCTMACAAPLRGDCLFTLFHVTPAKDDKLGQFWVFTGFLQDSLVLRVPEIDKICKDKRHKKFPEKFTITLTLQTA